jgi:ferrous iron transport protein B
MKTIKIALAGNPNAGKTTLFNGLTGSRQHVGNYPGVTVEMKEGVSNIDGIRVQIQDLPGSYSLTPYSEEERVAQEGSGRPPDVVIDVWRLQPGAQPLPGPADS